MLEWCWGCLGLGERSERSRFIIEGKVDRGEDWRRICCLRLGLGMWVICFFCGCVEEYEMGGVRKMFERFCLKF